jgi:hypothetical protein
MAEKVNIYVWDPINTVWVPAIGDNNGNIYITPVPPANTNTFKTGQKTVTTAGTPVQLSSVSVPVKAGTKLTVIAKPGNTGVIYFANSEAECVAGTYFDGLSAGLAHSFGVQDVQDIWIDASVNGEGVSWYCEQ